MVELLLGVQRLQVEEILLEEVNVRLQEGLAKRLPTKQNGGKGTDITASIRPARQNIIIFTPRSEQTPGSLRSFSVQQTKKRGVLSQPRCCQAKGKEGTLVGTRWHPCRTVATLGPLGTGGPNLH